MSEYWEPSASSGGPREFLVSAELYVSNSAAAGLRKPPIARKKPDKRDSVKPMNHVEESSKVKAPEKSSWLSLARSPASGGHWRPATCKLSEEGERCLLNIYVDESILYQTIYIHLLNQTDLRHADNSLFNRKECMGIYCAAYRWTSISTTADPVYLQFPTADICNTWLALLRSYAIPEIYGRWFFPDDGGSYRMWRQVELTVLQGRNLGTTKLPDTLLHSSGINSENGESDAVDLDLSCEILLNETLCGRTTVKRGLGSPEWHEKFTFTDLPPFDTLDLLVWREKKLFKPSALGMVQITLSNFRRGEAVEGWFPVLYHGPVPSDLQVGELRLKIRVDEEIILPYTAYLGLLKAFNSRNFLDWMADFESKLKLKTIASQLMSIAIARNVLIEQVQELALREVDGTSSSHQTLFRGNTTLTKVMELCMAWYGKAFLEASVGSVLRRLCAEKVGIEVDPMRNTKGPKDVERNVEQLLYWCREFWAQIDSAKSQCPQEMRRLFETTRKLVETRYRSQDDPNGASKDLPHQSVSAFCFLRFIVPAILHPHLFGLCPGLPSTPVQRSLTLIAKVIQSLANLNATVQKEEFMRGIKEFLTDKRQEMMVYLQVVSTPTDSADSRNENAADRHDRLHVVNSLRQRAMTMAVLERESIPILPHLLDVPRHLAIITSAVIRNSREFFSKASTSPNAAERALVEFCSKCFEVEEHALHRVSQLATKISSDRRRTSSSSWGANTISPSSTRQAATASPLAPGGRRRKKSGRPSTAPSPSESSHRHFSVDEPPTPRFPRHNAAAQDNPREDKPARPPHLKSPSSDSVPLGGRTTVPDQRPTEAADSLDDAGKRKKGLLRGILRR
ncbi:Rho GTPase activation protein [Pluteus cervinus]|uniref:Rho GTPase activation protein n=1 Tax=Pluteus cervinus TaxID=181527 RepID=A0ACD3BG55_9AGAR|nr:Rho GTPase activation protein [Pluteus cervinus]